jgi:hypothetical protein
LIIVDNPTTTTAHRAGGRTLEVKHLLQDLTAIIGLAFLVAISPFLLLASQCESRPQKDKTAADGKRSEECLAYARGYAQGVEDTASYRRRSEEAEAKLAKMSRGRHDQIVNFEPYDDGWFTFNLATNQAQM